MQTLTDILLIVLIVIVGYALHRASEIISDWEYKRKQGKGK